MAPELIVDNASALATTLTRRLQDEAARALAARGRFSIALPGGSTAEAFFPALAQASADWSRVDFFWGDERAVPPDDPDSNYGLARRSWFEPAAVPADNVHRMRGEARDLEAAAREHEAVLARVAGTPPVLDFVLLGAGPDGHVCSLFPGHPALGETRRTVVVVTDSPKPPPRRLTLTMPVLLRARLVVLAPLGASKAEALRDAWRDPRAPLPVATLIHRAGPTLVLADAEAVRLLG